MTARRRLSDRRRRVRRVLWNLRGLALFLIGPVAGILLADAIFGLPRNLLIAAAVMFGFSLLTFGLLIRGEWRRLPHGP